MKTLLLGDFSPTALTDPLIKDGKIDELFGDTLGLFENNDINFVNLECVITDSEGAIKKFGPPLKCNANTARVLKQIGVNCVGVSNNHFFDYGIAGAKDTLEYLQTEKIEYTGFGDNYNDSRKNLVIQKGGERVCIIAVCEHEYSYALEDRMGCRPFDEYDTPEDIRAAKAQNDRVIVIYHGGKEHCRYPSPRLIKAARAMVKSGADVVLCQHSHCIGCYENYNGAHILYGQGNFHFVDSPVSSVDDSWDTSLAVKYDTVTNNIEFVPIINCAAGITLAKGEEREKILNGFDARNAELQNGEWKKGWHEFCLSVKDSYIKTIAKACCEGASEKENAKFAHYLDCEAHTDVWRELFPTYNQTNEKKGM